MAAIVAPAGALVKVLLEFDANAVASVQPRSRSFRTKAPTYLAPPCRHARAQETDTEKYLCFWNELIA
jgi:hypothetical protein